MKKLILSGFVALATLLVGVSVVLAHNLSSVQSANCFGYEISARYSGDHDDRKIVWDVDLKVNGVTQHLNGSWEGKSSGFDIFKKTGGKADVEAKGYVKVYKHGFRGSWVEESSEEFDLNFHKFHCATPTPSATPRPTHHCSPTPTPTIAPTNTPEPTIEPTSTPEPSIEPTSTPKATEEPQAEVASTEGGTDTVSAPECTNSTLSYPMHISALSVGNSVHLTWTKVPGASGYSIMYGPTSGNLLWGVPDTGDTDNFIVNGLSTGYFTIRSLNGCMPGDPSALITTGGNGGGQVLGASTMAGTGLFDAFSFYKALVLTGVSSVILGLVFLARNESRTA